MDYETNSKFSCQSEIEQLSLKTWTSVSELIEELSGYTSAMQTDNSERISVLEIIDIIRAASTDYSRIDEIPSESNLRNKVVTLLVKNASQEELTRLLRSTHIINNSSQDFYQSTEIENMIALFPKCLEGNTFTLKGITNEFGIRERIQELALLSKDRHEQQVIENIAYMVSSCRTIKQLVEYVVPSLPDIKNQRGQLLTPAELSTLISEVTINRQKLQDVPETYGLRAQVSTLIS